MIEINEMEEADAITLLLKASYLDASAEHIEVAKKIVTELGCMPLAVDQAGAYIEVGGCSIFNNSLYIIRLLCQMLHLEEHQIMIKQCMGLGIYLSKK